DQTGTNPLLTSDPNGNAFIVNVNLDGTTGTSAFSSVTLTAVPEPGAFLPLALALLGFAPALLGQAILNADGVTAAYARIQGVLHAAPENPDCSHPAFGPHITQTLDSDLGKYAFVFNIHVTPDNDRCSAFDRQRLEIKTEGNASTPDYLKGFLNDTVTFRWKFKLPAGFQPSTSFTHIHQIKAYDGDAGSPLVTLTPRKGNPNFLELIHINSKGVTTHLTNTPLAPFLGEWVEGYEKITYSSTGQYSLVINRLSDGATLFSYSNSNLDLWRTGTTVVRPKWGIYRSLDHPEQLRDEQVRYDRFCLAKGTDDCPSDQALPDFSIAANPAGPGQYAVDVTPLRGFDQSVSLSVHGLPAAASASFTPGILNVATSGGTPPGSYSLIILGSSGILSHAATTNLVVDGTSGDVNGDGTVDCADLNLVRAAFHAYNSRADFNGDGVVDIRDLAFASRQIPAGATCE
ncbi:MAG TPA: dockerin type I domain-containing protein, partial [Bryobacteraceae bacterium]|nr:dockerin type I domain-containing protein [Bryobacteraceae bacterium]